MNCRNARETLVRTDPCGVRLNYRTVLSRIPRSVAPQKVIAELGVLRPAESVRSPPIRGDGPPSLGHYGNLGSGAAFTGGQRSRNSRQYHDEEPWKPLQKRQRDASGWAAISRNTLTAVSLSELDRSSDQLLNALRNVGRIGADKPVRNCSQMSCWNLSGIAISPDIGLLERQDPRHTGH
jgi:hypothetical protein